jgi:hypothetical protein
MPDEIINQVIDEIRGFRDDLRSLKVAVMGDPSLRVDGMQQRIDHIAKEVGSLKKDVQGLKNDRVKVVAWVSGIAAGCSVAGTKLVEWFKA